METPMDLGDRKQLFLDDRWFAQQQGMTLCVNPPVKADRVLVPKRPWEASRLSGGTILEDEGVYRMWYRGSGPGDPVEVPHSASMCYAESGDGIRWERPNVNLFTWEGITENNIVMPGTHGGVMKDPNGPDEHRYKALVRIRENSVWPESRGAVFTRHGGKMWSELYLATSPDGLRWTRQEPSALPFFHDTLNHFLFDRRIGKYVAYVRTHAGGRTVGRVEFGDPMDLPWPYEDRPESLRGPGLSRKETGGELPVVLTADESDPPDVDLYTPAVQQYPWAEDAYFSFTSPYRHYPVGDVSDTAAQGKDPRGRYRNDGVVEVQLVVSRDGAAWSRPDRRPYVPVGLDGSWDAGQVYMSLGMVGRGDEIWQYYSGTQHTHGAYDPCAIDGYGGVGRLVQRLDGFLSADAAYGGAEFTTPLLTFSGPRLVLNANCSALGQVWVEIRDEANNVFPGYSLAECIDVDRNHIAAPVAWKARDHAGELTGRPVRLHFKLRACKLYSFQFCA